MTDKRASPSSRHLRSSDLPAAVSLIGAATLGITSIVEGVHQAVRRSLGLAAAADGRRSAGLTGLVYRSIEGITKGSVWTLEQTLAALLQSGSLSAPASEDPAADSWQRDVALAVLNGVIGDRLAAQGNALATPMSLRYQGRSLDMSAPLPLPDSQGKLLLLVHGLCMNDRQWRVQCDSGEFDHGQMLAQAHGYCPLYLRYNSGRAIADNAAQLAELLDQMVKSAPQSIDELSLLGHSMGGLVLRSALHQAQARGLEWPQRVKHLVFLGTPHHGAPLERAGHWVDRALVSNRFSAPFAALGLVRSRGITDLRHARLHAHEDDSEVLPIPLPTHIACHTVAASLATRRSPLKERLLGDGLVPLPSALGQHAEPARCLRFAASSRHVVYRTGHIELLSSPAVASQLDHWLR